MFGFLLIIMLLTGINYQNSLIYLMTFLLGAIFVAAMHQTHRNLSGLELTLIKAGDGFAGDDIPFTLRAAAPDENAAAVRLSTNDRHLEHQNIHAGEPIDLVVLIKSSARGYLSMDQLRVETRFPFGLLSAWSWMRPAAQGVVFPRPITPPDKGVPSASGDNAAEERSSEGHDHAELRPWRAGDLSQRVLWKRYARSGDMIIADWEGERGSPQWLDYDAFPGTDPELRLSYLSAQVLDRERSGSPYGLKLPGQVIEPDDGAAHKVRCLRALAVFGVRDEG
ncbi:MAG: DUF58 domain-containing protein [Marinobacter sp.]|uniref:DUF58 domain-containing protein n=1 Tax=Marinobacter sp. TaxID=50741 RepID=UPI0034A01A6B